MWGQPRGGSSPLFGTKIMKYPNYSKEIIQMARVDQSHRLKMQAHHHSQEWRDELHRIDKTNTVRMKNIMEQIGWPTISLVGKKASHAAWLLVQHADDDVGFQKTCLRLMKKNSTDISTANIAYLTDRVLVGEDKKQLYGTQYIRSKDRPDIWVPHPISNAANVDFRRKKMGLQTLQENIDEINQNKPYGTKASSLK